MSSTSGKRSHPAKKCNAAHVRQLQSVMLRYENDSKLVLPRYDEGVNQSCSIIKTAQINARLDMETAQIKAAWM